MNFCHTTGAHDSMKFPSCAEKLRIVFTKTKIIFCFYRILYEYMEEVFFLYGSLISLNFTRNHKSYIRNASKILFYIIILF